MLFPTRHQRTERVKGLVSWWDRLLVAVAVVSIYLFSYWLIGQKYGPGNVRHHKTLFAVLLILLYVLFFSLFFSVKWLIRRMAARKKEGRE